MTSSRRQEARRVFMEVADLPAEAQAAALEEASEGDAPLRAEVDALLHAEVRAGGFMADPTSDAAGAQEDGATIAATPREQVGEQIGRYKLLEQIGEGGFGVVWAAEQREPVKRRVALKIIKLGMDTKQVIARFEAERQALAMMDHPNIAKVLDAGATETGRPFFVMELVKGVPILDYCDTEKMNTKARLELFTKICHAIQHAHQKGIIHRDIKPSNVLVTLHDGVPVPKVIDFGIAKATNAELTNKTIYTQHRQMIGTPAYMSPEQAEMSGLDIDTRSDVYSLGVLLYELLTGTTPFENESLMQAGFVEMMRIIREETPHKPSTRLSSLGETASRTAMQRHAGDVSKLGLLLRGDLDWIVMKCLEKDRTRRYETANGLAADIVRHLSDEPVVAGPPSASYKMRKFVRRNKGQVIAASIVGAALVLGVAGTTSGMIWALNERDRADTEATNATLAAEAEEKARHEAEANAQKAIEEAERAERELARATEIKRLITEMLQSVSPEEAQGADVTLLKGILDDAAERLAGGEITDELVAAELHQTIGVTYRHLGIYDKAETHLENAVNTCRRTLGNDHEDTINSINSLAVLLSMRGSYDEAERYSREAVERSRRIHGDDHTQTLASISNLGLLLCDQGKYGEAEQYLRESLDHSRRIHGDDHQSTLQAIHNMGWLLQAMGRLDEAEQHYRTAIEGDRRILGEDHPGTTTSIKNLSDVLVSQGKYEEAEVYCREALERSRRVLGEDHPDTVSMMHSMGVLLSSQGKYDEAEPYLRESLDHCRRVLGDDHPRTLAAIHEMGQLLDDQGKLDESERYLREALDRRRRILGDDHPDTLGSINRLGGVLHRQGKLDEAEPYNREALAIRRRVLGDDHPSTLNSINDMGVVLMSQGKLDEAEPYIREALDRMRRVIGEDHPDTVTAIGNMGVVLGRQGKLDEAEPYAREALERRRRVLGDDHPKTLGAIHNMGSLLQAQSKFDEARPYLQRALDGSRRVLSQDDPRTHTVIRALAQVLEALGEYDEAAALHAELLESTRRTRPHDRAAIASALAKLASIAQESSDPDVLADAVAAARECVAIRTDIFADSAHERHWLLHNARNLLGGALLANARHTPTDGDATAILQEAESILIESSEWMFGHPERVPENSRERIVEAVQRVVDYYLFRHSREPDAGHDANAVEWSDRLPAGTSED